MNKNALQLLNQLAGAKTRIKEIHWDAKRTSEHELADKVSDSLNSFEDSFAEEVQSLYGRIKPKELKPVPAKSTTLKDFINEVLDDVKKYYETLDEGVDSVGLKSIIETFIHDWNIFGNYLVYMTMQEGKTGKIVRITESQMERITSTIADNLLKENTGEKISGTYTFGNAKVLVDEKNNFLEVSRNGSMLWSDQSAETGNIIKLLKAQASIDQRPFSEALKEWVTKNILTFK